MTAVEERRLKSLLKDAVVEVLEERQDLPILPVTPEGERVRWRQSDESPAHPLPELNAMGYSPV